MKNIATALAGHPHLETIYAPFLKEAWACFIMLHLSILIEVFMCKIGTRKISFIFHSEED